MVIFFFTFLTSIKSTQWKSNRNYFGLPDFLLHPLAFCNYHQGICQQGRKVIFSFWCMPNFANSDWIPISKHTRLLFCFQNQIASEVVYILFVILAYLNKCILIYNYTFISIHISQHTGIQVYHMYTKYKIQLKGVHAVFTNGKIFYTFIHKAKVAMFFSNHSKNRIFVKTKINKNVCVALCNVLYIC